MGLLKKTNLNRISHRTKLGNRGMSFVEMIAVIAIMAIVAVGFVSLTGLILSGDAKKAAKTVGTQLADVKNKTLSIYGSWRCEIYVNDRDIYELAIYKADGGEEVSKTTLGSNVDVVFIAGGTMNSGEITGGTEYSITDTERLVIRYAQGTGEVESVKVGAHDMMTVDGTSGVIKVYSGNTKYYLRLYYKTGKLVEEY